MPPLGRPVASSTGGNPRSCHLAAFAPLRPSPQQARCRITRSSCERHPPTSPPHGHTPRPPASTPVPQRLLLPPHTSKTAKCGAATLPREERWRFRLERCLSPCLVQATPSSRGIDERSEKGDADTPATEEGRRHEHPAANFFSKGARAGVHAATATRARRKQRHSATALAQVCCHS